jgi:hypothetical protein
LKTEAKTLSAIGVRAPAAHAPKSKSFLVLFFKKELLSSSH